MNAKKFLIIALLLGILRICHAAPSLNPSISFTLPQAKQLSVYPCLVCPGLQAHANSNCLTQALQAGMGIQITF